LPSLCQRFFKTAVILGVSVKTKFDEQLKIFLCNEMGSNHSKKITLVFE
jgi:hypothetical protein